MPAIRSVGGLQQHPVETFGTDPLEKLAGRLAHPIRGEGRSGPGIHPRDLGGVKILGGEHSSPIGEGIEPLPLGLPPRPADRGACEVLP